MRARGPRRVAGGSSAQIGAVAGVNAAVGATVAATAVDLGISGPMSAVLTAGMFSGAAQFAAMSTQAAGSGPPVVILAAMLVNARFILLGASVAATIGGARIARLVVAPLLVDPIVVISKRAPDARSARRLLVGGGLVTLLSWGLGAVAGAFGAARIDNPSAFGLDIALPALLLAILASSARSAEQRSATLAGAVIAALLLLAGVASSLVVLLAAFGCVGPMLAGGARRTTGDVDAQDREDAP